MFHVRTLTAGSRTLESSTLELTPTNEQGSKVCELFLEFLGGSPTEFREKIPFLKRGDLTLDWAAAQGGVALATFLDGSTPLSVCALASGIDPEADAQMLGHFAAQFPSPELRAASEVAERPLMVQVLFSASPEWLPATQLLSASLASVYFRAILALHAETPGAIS